MREISLISLVTLLALNGFFNDFASAFGLTGFGDHIAAAIISFLATPLVSEHM